MLSWNSYKLKETLANFISTFGNAPLIAIFVFLVLNYYLLNGSEFIMVTLVCMSFAVLLPILIAYLWVKSKNLDIDMPHKEDRLYPLLWILISYLLGAIVLYVMDAPAIITVLMFCYFSNTMVVLFISFFWKISIHSVGIAGPVAFLIYVFGYYGLIFLALIPLIMWSRLILKRHTLNQVIAGACLGFILTTAQIYLFLGF
ncbi:MAG TPA: PAP2 family protein [Methanobacterium sp.]|nr:PAP2 family protein [Methanobacterium sp.]